MTTDTLQTLNTQSLVIFRRYRSDHLAQEVFALFPQEPGTCNPATCLAYGHVGQHSSADPTYCIRASVPATPSEHEDLRIELERIGYTLRIGQRIPRNAYAVRARKVRIK